MTRIKGLYEELYKRFGNAGLDLIRYCSASSGAAAAERARRDGDPWTVKQVGGYLVRAFNNMRSEGKVTEFNVHRVAIMVPRCPYPFTNPEICAAHTAMERALVKGLNPELDYRIEKCLPRGDAYCLHVVADSNTIQIEIYPRKVQNENKSATLELRGRLIQNRKQS